MSEDKEDISDLTLLLDCDNEIITQTLIQRYKNESIYTNVGPVLIALNPFKDIPGLYAHEKMKSYYDTSLGFDENLINLLNQPSHIFAIAGQAYINLCRGQNQSIVISGESGRSFILIDK